MQEEEIKLLSDLILASVEILYNLRGDETPKSAKDVDVQKAKEIIEEIVSRKKLNKYIVNNVKENLERLWDERAQTSPNSKEQIQLVKNALNSYLASSKRDLEEER